MDYYKKYQSQEWVNIQQEMEEDENSASIMDDFKENNNLKIKPMKLTKKQLTNGTKFKTKFSKHTVYTLYINENKNNFVTTDILFETIKNKAIVSNHYLIESITDKYFKMWDIQFGQKRIFKVKLSDIKIVNIEYKTI
jgi:hypothetical protein